MIPLFTSEHVRAADNHAIKKLKISGEILMENAAISIVTAIFEKYPYLDSSYKFGIVCGKGNNGGDGYVMARLLSEQGWQVETLILGKEADITGDAEVMLNILQKLELPHSFVVEDDDLKARLV